MKLENQIRKLARSNYWQGIYNASRECNGVQLFANNYNFSAPQQLMLYWVKVYSMLYDEFTQLKWENLDKKVIKDNDRCDAFLYWRSKQIEKDIRKSKREEKKARRKSSKTMKIFSGVKTKEGEK